MDQTYRTLAEFAQTWGLVYFVAVFASSCWLMRCGRRASVTSTKRPAFPFVRTDMPPIPAHDQSDIDPVTGTATTGHEWDGIRELNTPLPRWWLWIFYATIVWSIGYWIVYPAWPLIAYATNGRVRLELARAPWSADLDRPQSAARRRWSASLPQPRSPEIVADPQLLGICARAGPRRLRRELRALSRHRRRRRRRAIRT